ncbi:MAG: hypothetical protein V2B18_00315 [Pseudomonadota bacterium]
MKSLLFAAAFVFCVGGSVLGESPAPTFTVKDLEGSWVTEGSVKALEETLMPTKIPTKMVIWSRGVGRSSELSYDNATEGVEYEILGLHHVNADEYALGARMYNEKLDGRIEYSPPQSIRLILSAEETGRLKHVAVLGNPFGLGEHRERFVRVPTAWWQYINRLVFAGRWVNERGKVFCFEESGGASRPGGHRFTYEVPLSLGGDTLDVYPSDALRPTRWWDYLPEVVCMLFGLLGPDHQAQYRFKRIGNELRFYRLRGPNGEWVSEDSPFLVLKKQ